MDPGRRIHGRCRWAQRPPHSHTWRLKSGHRRSGRTGGQNTDRVVEANGEKWGGAPTAHYRRPKLRQKPETVAARSPTRPHAAPPECAPIELMQLRWSASGMVSAGIGGCFMNPSRRGGGALPRSGVGEEKGVAQSGAAMAAPAAEDGGPPANSPPPPAQVAGADGATPSCQAAFRLGGRVAGTTRTPRYSSRERGWCCLRDGGGGGGGCSPLPATAAAGGHTVSCPQGCPPTHHPEVPLHQRRGRAPT